MLTQRQTRLLAIGLIGSLTILAVPRLSAQAELWSRTIEGVSGFGSPGTADLTGDGVLDIVVGMGMENAPTATGTIALDGHSGAVLWQVPATSQVYTRPLFEDIDADGVADIFIAGRSAQLWAIDGRTGQVHWCFDAERDAPASGWLNFYVPQWIPDQDGDGIRDLLIANGGDATAPPTQRDRPPGYLLAISSADGRILARGEAPDGKEIYATPLLLDAAAPSDPTVIIGTGGETIGGTLYRVRLSQFMATGLAGAVPIATHPTKGYIAPPVAADLNGDGTADLLVPELAERLLAIDGRTYEPLWNYRAFDHEHYVAPAIGFFNDDAVPDVATLFAFGSWPLYFGNQLVLLDGTTGTVIQRFTLPSFQISSPVVLDIDNDGIDEVLLLRNDETPKLTVRYGIYSAREGTERFLTEPVAGMSFFSTPTVADLRQDGSQVAISIVEERDFINEICRGATVRVHALPSGIGRIAWPAFLGHTSNGLFVPPYSSTGK